MTTRVPEPGGPWILTYTGRAFFPLDPRPEDVTATDVSHGLANKCRFNGQCSPFYSVAEHSCHVAFHLATKYGRASLTLAGLLHDGSEAFLPDVPTPVKRDPAFAAYWNPIEARAQTAVYDAFGVPDDVRDCPELHEADQVLLATEKRDLCTQGPSWGPMAEPLPQRIRPLLPEQAEIRFRTMLLNVLHAVRPDLADVHFLRSP